MGSVFHLKRHENSKSHREKYKAALSTPSLVKVLDKTAAKIEEQKVNEAELKHAVFLAEHNLLFSLMDHLPQIIASACPDSKIALKLKIKRKKAIQLIKVLIGPSNKDELILDLKENYFSIILDETTDISTSKCLAVIARYYKNNKIWDRFFILVEVENSTANGLFQAIKGMLTKYTIQTCYWFWCRHM
ncbi:hypothetical protein NQ314_002081 [Rhamnusium bicolor]|uniref:DUF4371 domain-containing protein n=1 Tax=Rhamnusium bicolor TaxID=1586634 RepID=A0AAV8ZSG8_9CUCU|nr:hypothetical protein NQ314_002081 [Rhamnusium bicolor]